MNQQEPATPPLAGPGGPGAPRAPGVERPRRRGRFIPRRKVCAFCADHIDYIDYKDPSRLRRYVSERGKIEPRRKTGTCARHQRTLTQAIKRARHVALLPFTAAHMRDASPPQRFERGPAV
jgi:small subunit ribosomal protein S18